jgi:lipopolysaccharide export system protein LptA
VRPGGGRDGEPRRGAGLLWAALALTLLLAAPSPGAAQILGLTDPGASDQPLEITADEGIEWRRDERVYIASGNARASRGDFSVQANQLIAHYRDNGRGGNEIWKLEARANVRFVSSDQTIQGDHAVYDVDKGLLLVTGKDLRAVTPKETVTAEQSFEYWKDREVVVARGNATATSEDRTVRADTLTGYFRKDVNGQYSLFQVEATGNVQIRSPEDYASGDKAVYSLDRQIATLTGDVKITRGDAQLQGQYAEVNLKTHVSRILGGVTGTSTSRVHTLIIPSTKPQQPSP